MYLFDLGQNLFYLHLLMFSRKFSTLMTSKLFMRTAESYDRCDIEAAVWRCSVEKLFLNILQNSQENPCVRASF